MIISKAINGTSLLLATIASGYIRLNLLPFQLAHYVMSAPLSIRLSLNESLLASASMGNLPMTVALLKAGADVNWQDENGDTPLHVVFSHAKNDFFSAQYLPDVIEVLMNAGADINARNHAGEAPVHLAAENNCPASISQLATNENLKLNTHSFASGTPIYIAYKNEAWNAYDALVKHGAEKSIDRHQYLSESVGSAIQFGLDTARTTFSTVNNTLVTAYGAARGGFNKTKSGIDAAAKQEKSPSAQQRPIHKKHQKKKKKKHQRHS